MFIIDILDNIIILKDYILAERAEGRAEAIKNIIVQMKKWDL